MKKPLFFLVLLVFLLNIECHAQNWVKDVRSSDEFKFSEVSKSFNEYWSDKLPYKGSGFKQYKRLEWLVKPRFWKTDKIPDLGSIYKQWKDFANKKRHEDKELETSEWISLGPKIKPNPHQYYPKSGIGRVSCIEFDPVNNDIQYAGSATGGIWKSTNAGKDWIDLPLSEFMSIGISDIMVSQSNNNVVYAGTGDADASGFLGVNFSFSIGVIKSTNAGQTWIPTNLSFQISDNILVNKVLVHPQNENLVYAATNKGIYKTTDGGSNWDRVNTNSCRDMKFKTDNPAIIYVAMQSNNHIYTIEKYLTSTGTFVKQLELSDVGRITLATNKKKPLTIYALMCKTYPTYAFHSVWRTDNGESWTKRCDYTNSPNYLYYIVNGSGVEGQGLYDLALATNPDNAEEVYLGGVNIFKSTNGGTNFTGIAEWTGQFSLPWVHADIHMLEFDDNNNLYACTDGGLNRSSNGGENWADLSDGMEITQFYSISGSVQNENLITGGSQDNGTHLYDGKDWKNLYGGDGMKTIIDYSNPNIIYISLYYGRILKSTNGGTSFNEIISFDHTGEEGEWVTPYLLHPTNNNTIYVALENIWRSTNAGSTWSKVSNFAQTNPRTKIQALAISEQNPNVLYMSRENKIYKTTMGGGTWTTVGAMSEYVTSIVVDPKSQNRFWVTLSGYTAGNKVVYYNGQGWDNISSGLPNVPVNCLTYQLNTQNRLYCGTDVGVFTRDDANRDWVQFAIGMPNVIVNSLEIHQGSGNLRAGTYGRGLWETSVVDCNLAPPEIEVTGSLELCEGDSVKLECKGSYLSYEWSTGTKSKFIWVTSQGQYKVTVKDENGCTATSEEIFVKVTLTPEFSIKNLDSDTICEGSSTRLIASTFAYKYYKWSNGDSTKKITVTQPGTYWVECMTETGCKEISQNEITIATRPAPEKPRITESGNKLISSLADAYQWYLNDEILDDEINREIIPKVPGIYKVEVFDANSCSSFSDDYNFTTDIEETRGKSIKIIPNPTTGVFRIVFGEELKFGKVEISINNISGQVVFERRYADVEEGQILIDLSMEMNGVYFVNIKTGIHSSIYKIIKK